MTVTVIGDNTTGSPGMDYSGTEDCEMRQLSATTNNGSAIDMEVGKWVSGSDEVSVLLSFSGLSNIDSGELVSDAVISLYRTGHIGTHSIDSFRLLRDWVEAEATWNIWATSNNWTTAGALHADDRSASSGTSASWGTADDEYKEVTSAQLIADTEDFIDGTYSNYGWNLEITGAVSGHTSYLNASDITDTDQRPYITVTHSTPTATITGTAQPTSTEAQIVSGGRTVIITLANDTWI